MMSSQELIDEAQLEDELIAEQIQEEASEAELEEQIECLGLFLSFHSEEELERLSDVSKVCVLQRDGSVTGWPVDFYDELNTKLEGEEEEEEDFEYPEPPSAVICPFCRSKAKPEFLGFWGGWIEGKEPDYWTQLRMYVFWRDDFRCRKCRHRFSPDLLVAHHIMPKEKGGTDSADNLATECYRCHPDDKPIYNDDESDN